MKGALQQRVASDCVGWVLSVMSVIAVRDKHVVISVVMILPNVMQTNSRFVKNSLLVLSSSIGGSGVTFYIILIHSRCLPKGLGGRG